MVCEAKGLFHPLSLFALIHYKVSHQACGLRQTAKNSQSPKFAKVFFANVVFCLFAKFYATNILRKW